MKKKIKKVFPNELLHGEVELVPANRSMKIFVYMEREFLDGIKYVLCCALFMHFLSYWLMNIVT